MTKIVFSFDTEDFTNPAAADAIKTEADILRDQDVRGCFCMVGLLAAQLREWKREDVIGSLRYHEIDLHSLTHSVHPLINEYTDVADFEKAKKDFLRRETYSAEIIDSIFHAKKFFAAVPPGNQDSYVAMHGYSEMGVPIYSDSICDPDGDGIFYCNSFHTAYAIAMEDFLFSPDPFRIKRVLNKLAEREIAVIYTHPHRAVLSESWDILNFDKKNLHGYDDWVMSKKQRGYRTSRFYKNMQKMVRLIKKDSRFVIKTFEEIADEYIEKEERIVKIDQVPTLYASLSKGLGPISSPSLSLCDMFFACAEFLQGKTSHTCGRVYGPMDRPEGILYPVTLSRKEVFESARQIDTSRPVPNQIRVGEYRIGPADWLFAALQTLCGADKIELQPASQLPNLDRLPKIRDCNFKGTWRHADTFKDEYLSDRLRYQSWTMRYPEKWF